MKFLVLAAALLSFAPAGAALPPSAIPPAPRVADGLLSHRAVYDLSLKSSTWGSGMTSFNGKLVSEFNDACSGYTSNQRLVSSFVDDDGMSHYADQWNSSYEASTGLAYRFASANVMNGERIENVNGRAELSGAGGTVRYADNEGRTDELPAGVLFPTQYLGRLIGAARAGETAFRGQLFDGYSEGKIYDVITVIGKSRPPTAAELALEGGEALKGQRGWPISVSYHPAESKDELPEMQVSYTLFENGVATDTVIDYGDFTLVSRMRRIEKLAAPGC